jgi:hypothetical protein
MVNHSAASDKNTAPEPATLGKVRRKKRASGGLPGSGSEIS